MSNKTAPAKDTTEEYREDTVENTAIRRAPKGVSESGSEDGPEEAADLSATQGASPPRRPQPAWSTARAIRCSLATSARWRPIR